MEAATDDVTLNIYELQADDETRAQHGGAIGFFTRVLTPMGMGAYHTSITVRGGTYVFGGGAGICKSNQTHHNVPPTASFHSSVTLGSCIYEKRSEIQQIILKLGEFFRGTSYHLLNRNCNHFTETFALCLLHSVPELCDKKKKKKLLETYPGWINRLSKTGSNFVNDGDVCNPLEEAKAAVDAEGKMAALNFENMSSSDNGAKSGGKKAGKDKGKKKELTEKQKAALAKLKGNK